MAQMPSPRHWAGNKFGIGYPTIVQSSSFPTTTKNMLLSQDVTISKIIDSLLSFICKYPFSFTEEPVPLHCNFLLHSLPSKVNRSLLALTLIIIMSLLLLLLLLVVKPSVPSPQLRPGFYNRACPGAEPAVRAVMRRAMAREPRSAASVMRLQFHDCFVNGCDASLLLDDTAAMLGEKLALANINSLRSYEVIDEAKEALETACPGVVSCADIIVMAARDAVALSGGPDWEVRLGRLDSQTASQEDSDNIMPSPRANATTLINLFHRFNLTTTDLVALSGSHSIGEGRCFSIVFRLYNQSGTGKPDPALDPAYRRHLNRLCPRGGDGNITEGLDGTPVAFDNRYFKDLARGRGFLNSDQTLFSGNAETRELVRRFSVDQDAFFAAFVEGMLKMGDLQQPGRPGEIRRNCRVANDYDGDNRRTCGGSKLKWFES